MTTANRGLGPLPSWLPVKTVDEREVAAPPKGIFDLARAVEQWPAHLAHYRFVRFRERDGHGGGIVEMSANRPFTSAGGLVALNWPTWWLSEMQVDEAKPAIRFHHIGGITKRMEVEWTFAPAPRGTHVRIVHVWEGPRWPLVGLVAAKYLIGPVFVHGIASRTLAGLAAVAERNAENDGGRRV